jgi:hypothetical protein
LAEFSGGLATIFAGLEPAGLPILSIFQAKVKATPQANLAALHLSIAMEWDQLLVEYIHKTCLSFRYCW